MLYSLWAVERLRTILNAWQYKNSPNEYWKCTHVGFCMWSSVFRDSSARKYPCENYLFDEVTNEDG